MIAGTPFVLGRGKEPVVLLGSSVGRKSLGLFGRTSSIELSTLNEEHASSWNRIAADRWMDDR